MKPETEPPPAKAGGFFMRGRVPNSFGKAVAHKKTAPVKRAAVPDLGFIELPPNSDSRAPRANLMFSQNLNLLGMISSIREPREQI
jgi:hypothetical protein